MSLADSSQPLRVLMIYYLPEEVHKSRVALLSHLRALEHCACPHEVTYYNVYDDAPYWIGAESQVERALSDRIRSDAYDAVILHYSFLSVRTVGSQFFDWKRRYQWIADLPCPKIALPMDEGDCHEVLDEWLVELDVAVIFSVHYRPERPLYSHMHNRATIHPCLPGYVDPTLAEKCEASRRSIAHRTRDVVYRARQLPYRFGRAGQLKHRVGEVFLERATDVVMDISTDPSDTIFGDAWMEFLASSRTVLGAEGGFSAIDWRGELKARINAILRDNPNLTFEEVDAQMPNGWDDYDLLTITPRHFETALARSGQVLIEGEYRGILIPDQHYIPLKNDFSNIDEVIDRIRDHRTLQEMADRTYEEVCLSGRYSYAAFGQAIESAIRNEHADRVEQPSVAAAPRGSSSRA